MSAQFQVFTGGRHVGVSMRQHVVLALRRRYIEWRARGVKRMGLKPHVVDFAQLEAPPAVDSRVMIMYETTF